MLGLFFDAVLVLVLVEAVALLVIYRRTGRGLPPRRLLTTLGAGFFLMLALKLLNAHANDLFILACLLASFVGHILDLSGRWNR